MSITLVCFLFPVYTYIVVCVVYRTVEYASRDDMKNALRKLDGAELNGRKLKLTEDRGGGGGGYSRYKDRRYMHVQCMHIP